MPPNVVKPLLKVESSRPHHSVFQKLSVQFEVKDDHVLKLKANLDFKYETKIQHQTDAEQVVQKILKQPIMLTLGEVLGSSFKLGK